MLDMVYRVRERRANGRTQIVDMGFASPEKAKEFVDWANKRLEKKPIPNVVRYEMASPKRGCGWY